LLTLFKSLALKRKATLLKMTIKNTFKDAKNEFDIVSLRGFSSTETERQNITCNFRFKVAINILKFALSQGISNKIYQKNLIMKLAHSNKTIIENLKELTNLRIFEEEMEKTMQNGHVVWVKTYRLSDSGKWFAMLLAEEKDLSEKEKAEILQNIFRTYIKSLKELSEKLNVKEETLKEIFEEEMRYKRKKR
jgi:hypothetical protein